MKAITLENFVRRAEEIVLSATIRNRDVSEFTPKELIPAEDPMRFFRNRMSVAKGAFEGNLRPEWFARQVLRAIAADANKKGAPRKSDGDISVAIAHAKSVIDKGRVSNG